MGFKKSKLKATYNSEDDSLLSDFYMPFLADAISYDRAVGFFSASMLTYASQGLSKFLSNNGKMRLIVGYQIDPDEFEAIQRGDLQKEINTRLHSDFYEVINEASSELFNCRLELLCWLIANGRLKIKFALCRKGMGMYHEKIGIFKDAEGDEIVFQGSANESKNALLPDFNFESISVYPSWKKEIFESYGLTYVNRFDRLWGNNSKKAFVIDIPSDLYVALAKKFPAIKLPPTANDEMLLADEFLRGDSNLTFLPKLPEELNGIEYRLKGHQKNALEKWSANGFNGIFALATGAGKTITALHAATKLFDYQSQLVVVVSVPYQNLADQWCSVMSLFSMEPIRCYMSKVKWQVELNNAITDFNLKKMKPFLAIVVVNNTLQSSAFQEELSRIDINKLLFVGDECHHHSSNKVVRKLPQAKYRIGLSATPWSLKEKEKQEIIKSYYSDIIYDYSIADALEDNVLTPYHYFIHPIHLTNEETENYQDISREAAKLEAIKIQGGQIEEKVLKMLYMKRARIIGSANNKFEKLDGLLGKLKKENHTLFYCGDGSVIEEYDDQDNQSNITRRDIERVATLLNKHGWKSSRFTASEALNERRRIIKNFVDEHIEAMVAIRVLDEGIDIPVCKQAFLLASSRNERQFIQRRGRILRKYTGKDLSVIHDFIVLPSEEINCDDVLLSLVSSEMDRVFEFSHVAANKDSAFTNAEQLSDKYGLDWLGIVYG